MVKIAIILFRNHMTLEEQHRWWLEDHAPIARRMPGLRGYVINLANREEAGEEPEICGTDELLFESWENAQAAYNSAEWKQAREHTLDTWVREVRIL
jgi:uncharacterized protein (TIGR02118 family)